MVMLLVTCVWLTWTLSAPAIVPTMTLLMGAFAGGGLKFGSRLIVRLKAVPRELNGELVPPRKLVTTN